jgi:hypothetical protein
MKNSKKRYFKTFIFSLIAAVCFIISILIDENRSTSLNTVKIITASLASINTVIYFRCYLKSKKAENTQNN